MISSIWVVLCAEHFSFNLIQGSLEAGCFTRAPDDRSTRALPWTTITWKNSQMELNVMIECLKERLYSSKIYQIQYAEYLQTKQKCMCAPVLLSTSFFGQCKLFNTHVLNVIWEIFGFWSWYAYASQESFWPPVEKNILFRFCSCKWRPGLSYRQT